LSVEADKKALARYRLEQAGESLDEATFLLSGEKSPRSIINRVYYAMFYAILALLIYEPYSSSKHSGVLGYFNRRFIKQGVFDREYFEVTRDQAADLVAKAGEFVSIVRSHLDAKWQKYRRPNSPWVP